MFFELRRSTLLRSLGALVVSAAAAGLTLSGCGLKIGERPNANVTVKLGSAETACLSGASQTLSDYLAGKSSEAQISGVFTCASSSLKLFEERTRGAEPNSYSPNELRKFLERYFLRDFSISDAFVSEAMELKSTLLGGSTDRLTVDELHRLREILDTLRSVSLQLRPFLPLTPATAKNFKTEDLATATQAMEAAAKTLGEIFERRSSSNEASRPYEFSHLVRLLEEVEKFLQNDDYVHRVAEIRDYIPLFQKLKAIFVSPDSERMIGSDWGKLLTRSAKIYGIALRFGNVVHSEPTLISGQGRESLMALAQEFFETVDGKWRDGHLVSPGIINNPKDHPDGVISYCQIYSALDDASDLFGVKQDLQQLITGGFKDYPRNLIKYLTNDEKKDDADYLVYFEYDGMRFYRGTIKQFLQPLFQVMLAPEDIATRKELARYSGPRFKDWWNACSPNQIPENPDHRSYAQLGLRAEHLERLWHMLQTISEGQRFLEKTFEWAGNFYDEPGFYFEKERLPLVLTQWSRPAADGTDPGLSDLFGVPMISLSDVTRQVSREMTGVIQTHLPFFRANDPQMTFANLLALLPSQPGAPVAPAQIGNWGQSFVSLSALNAIRQLVHLVWKGYIDPKYGDPKRVDQVNGGLTVEEVKSFYFDVRELGTAVRLFDPAFDPDATPKKKTPAEKRFLEGNLFTYSANGDQYLNVDEAQDLVGFLFSSKQLSSKIYKLVHDQCSNWYEQCPVPARDHGSAGASDSVNRAIDGRREDQPKSCHIGQVDLFGKEMISTTCFRKMAFGSFYQQIWDHHMPNLARYYDSLPKRGSGRSDEDTVYRETFSCMVEAIGKSDNSSSQWIDSGDIDQMAALYHYVEAIFVRFDRDHSGTLNQDEAYLAYPVLAMELKDFAKNKGVTALKSDDDFKAVLSYLLANGEIPSTNDIISEISVWLRSNIYSPGFEADRSRILQAIGVIIGADVSHCVHSSR